MLKKLYIVRHCEATGQPAQATLTETGFKQAEQLSDFLRPYPVDTIISSPFLRAVQSIEPFGKHSGIRIMTDERLSERILSDAPLPDWLERLKETFHDLDLKLPGGESSREAMDRIVAVLDDIQSENALIVTHGNIMALLLKHFSEDFGFLEWQNLSNPDVYMIDFTSKQVEIKRLWQVLVPEGE